MFTFFRLCTCSTRWWGWIFFHFFFKTLSESGWPNSSVTRLFAVRDSLQLDALCTCRRQQVCIIRFVVLTCNCQQIHSRPIQSYRTKDSNKMVTKTAAHCGRLHTRSPSSKHTNHNNFACAPVSKHGFPMCEYSINGHQVEIFLPKNHHCLDMMNLKKTNFFLKNQWHWFSVRSVGMGRWEWDS